MLEARTAASAASGRNGGHCRPGWWLNFKKYAEVFGEEEAIKFDQLEEQNVLDIVNFVRDNGVDCDFQDLDTSDVYVTERGWAEVLQVVRFREAVRKRRPDWKPLMRREVWHGEDAEKRLGLPNLKGAVIYPSHTQNPYLLVCKMLELSLDKGLNLQTNTPAIAVVPVCGNHEDLARWEVQTERGTILTRNVVLATNAYTNALHRGIANTNFLAPSRSQVAAIRAKRDLCDHPAMHISMAINDRGSGDYFSIRQPGLKGAGDLLFGGGRSVSKTREMGITDDSTVNEEIAAYLKQSAPEIFGRENWEEPTEEIKDWSGITVYTPDTFPLVGEVPDEPGIWASVGFNGHGMALAFRSAESLVTMMTTGKEPEWFPKSFSIERAWADPNMGLAISNLYKTKLTDVLD
jgi:glycine/D-amino acid oxidase-like deaminating enzyme